MSFPLLENLVVRFLLTRGVSAFVYYIVYVGMVELGQHYLVASAVGFVPYWLVHHKVTKTWTYTESVFEKKQTVQHLCLVVSLQLLLSGGLYILIDVAGIHYLVAQIVLSPILMVVSYLLTTWIFIEN